MKTANLADSKEWYETPKQAKAYLDLMSQGYASGIVHAEDSLLAKNLDTIVMNAPWKANYVDLGPGDGRKTLLLCQALHEAGKLKAYTAVDIQPKYLEIEKTIKRKFRIPTRTFQCSFEDFLTKPQSFRDMFPGHWKFIYLGATYGNFKEGAIESSLYNFMFGEDVVYLSAELRPENLQQLLKRYRATKSLFTPVAKKHGLRGGQMKVRFNARHSTMEVGYEKKDTFYVLGISRKPSVEEFKSQTWQFSGRYFVEDGHIGFLGKKK